MHAFLIKKIFYSVKLICQISGIIKPVNLLLITIKIYNVIDIYKSLLYNICVSIKEEKWQKQNNLIGI